MLQFIPQQKQESLLNAPNAEVGNRLRVKRNSLSTELVESGGSQNNLCTVNSWGKNSELGNLSSHLEAGNTGTGRGSRSRGIVSHRSLCDDEGGSHLRVEGIGGRQDEGEQKEDCLVGLHGYSIVVVIGYDLQIVSCDCIVSDDR